MDRNTRQRSCDKVWPSQLDLTGGTHLVLAFATIGPDTFAVGAMNPDDEEIYKQFLALSGVAKWIGLGGWELTDPGPTHNTWSLMTSTQQNRKAFIDSLKQFIDKWGFEGVDIDWEWPGNAERGGSSGDKQNQVSLLTEMRQALPNEGLSVVLPAQTKYLNNIDPKSLEAQVDFFNVLTYDLQGSWDTASGIAAHTDLGLINKLLEPLWTSNIDPEKVNLGVANYGRGYTIADKGCMSWGCPFTGPSKQGSCSGQPSVMSRCEMNRLMSEKGLTPSLIQGGAAAEQLTWDDQWMSFDDAATESMKLEFANERCLGGIALWAIDYAVCGGSGSPTPSQPAPGSSAAPSQHASAPSSSAAPSGAPASSNGPAPSPTGGSVSSPVPNGPSGTAPPWSRTNPGNSPGSSAASSPGVSSALGLSQAPTSGSPNPSAIPSNGPAPSVPDSSGAPGSFQAGSSGQASQTGQTAPSGSPGASGSFQAGTSGQASQTGQPAPSVSSGAPSSSAAGSSAARSSAEASMSGTPSGTSGPSSTASSSGSGQSSQSGPPSVTGSPSATSPLMSGTITSSAALTSSTPYCPPDCLSHDWCKPLCDKSRFDLDDFPPPQCGEH